MFTIAHISDLHIPPLPRLSARDLRSKRLIGLFSWHHKWKSEHRQRILESLLQRLEAEQPDHICITGDITFTTHQMEVDAAAHWFERLGDTRRVSLIPGNHDAYVPGALDYALDRWSRWMQDDDGHTGFPYLHRRGPVDLIGLSSAVVTPPAVSLGRLGQEQIGRTEALLERIRTPGRLCVLMLHHPPQHGAATRRRALSDRVDLQRMLARCPVDLILHGHLHVPVRASLEGPAHPIPVLGAASASTLGKRKSAAHFHLLDVETQSDQPCVSVRHAHFDPGSERFIVAAGETL
ncbi:MAG: metallophosphoesterase [Xanthomonadales bacterium]|nr:metallophosphoesterase [Xanthomonadales bacterium]